MSHKAQSAGRRARRHQGVRGLACLACRKPPIFFLLRKERHYTVSPASGNGLPPGFGSTCTRAEKCLEQERERLFELLDEEAGGPGAAHAALDNNSPIMSSLLLSLGTAVSVPTVAAFTAAACHSASSTRPRAAWAMALQSLAQMLA